MEDLGSSQVQWGWEQHKGPYFCTECGGERAGAGGGAATVQGGGGWPGSEAPSPAQGLRQGQALSLHDCGVD